MNIAPAYIHLSNPTYLFEPLSLEKMSFNTQI